MLRGQPVAITARFPIRDVGMVEARETEGGELIGDLLERYTVSDHLADAFTNLARKTGDLAGRAASRRAPGGRWFGFRVMGFGLCARWKRFGFRVRSSELLVDEF